MQVFQAHVNDLCASVFIAMVRQYNPDTKGAGGSRRVCRFVGKTRTRVCLQAVC